MQTEETKFTLRLPTKLSQEVGIVSKLNLKSMNGTYLEMIQYAVAKKFGVSVSKKQHFLEQNLVADMRLQDEIVSIDAQKDQIQHEFAEKALILSGNFGIKLTKDKQLQYSIDLIDYLRKASEINPAHYDSYVKVIRKILTRAQFDSLKKLM